MEKSHSDELVTENGSLTKLRQSLLNLFHQKFLPRRLCRRVLAPYSQAHSTRNLVNVPIPF